RISLVVAALILTACGDDPQPLFELYEPEPGTPERLAWDANIVGYLGTARPVATTDQGDGETTVEFDPADGPMCMRGAPYRASIRETESEDLMIFLQGGGACWSDFCLAVITAPAGIPTVDSLDRENPANPFADFDVLYLPYCDGSLFSGDRDA